MPFSRTNRGVGQGLSNDSNLLAGLTPVFAGWNVSPGTNADIVSEITDTLTTAGVQTNSVDSTILYDLGVSKRVAVHLFRSAVAVAKGAEVWLSDDNVTFYNGVIIASTAAARQGATIGKARYLKAVFYANVVGNTIAGINMRAYAL